MLDDGTLSRFRSHRCYAIKLQFNTCMYSIPCMFSWKFSNWKYNCKKSLVSFREVILCHTGSYRLFLYLSGYCALALKLSLEMRIESNWCHISENFITLNKKSNPFEDFLLTTWEAENDSQKKRPKNLGFNPMIIKYPKLYYYLNKKFQLQTNSLAPFQNTAKYTASQIKRQNNKN